MKDTNMINIVKDNIPELNIELMDDTNGSLILLEQDSDGNLDRIAIHPIQLRYMAENFGIIPTSDPQAANTIATLQRRLLVLAGRIEHLADYLRDHSDNKHANFDYELTYSNATADIASEFVAEFDDVQVGTEPPKRAPERVKPSTGADTRQMLIEA